MIVILALLAVATVLGVLTQTIAGLGFVFFLTPLLLVFFNAPTAITTTLLTASSLSLLILLTEKRQREFSWQIVVPLLLCALPGLFIGAFVVTHAKKELLQILVGIVIILAVLIQRYLVPKPDKELEMSKSGYLAGFVAGVLNTSTSMGGPPLALWLRNHKVTHHQIRDTLAVCFLCLNIAGIVVINLFKRSSLSTKGLLIALFLLPFVIIAHRLGIWLLKRIDPKHYGTIITIVLIGTGLASIVLGLVNW